MSINNQRKVRKRYGVAVTVNPPVQNTWYSVDLSSIPQSDIRVKRIVLYQSNTETDSKTVEVELTADGQTYEAAFTLSDNDPQVLSPQINVTSAGVIENNLVEIIPPAEPFISIDLECSTITLLRFRTTDALGTAPILQCLLECDA